MPKSAVAERLPGDQSPPFRKARPIPEALQLLGISQSHLYALMAAGRVKSIKIGARRLVPDAEIERIAAEGV